MSEVTIQSIQEDLLSLEEKIGAAELVRIRTERDLTVREEGLRRAALDAVASLDEAALKRYEALREKVERDRRRLEMAEQAIAYGEERVEALRRRLRGEIAREAKERDEAA